MARKTGLVAVVVHIAAGLMVMLVAYEVVGGLRAVAWTDFLQGMVLLIGSMGFLLVIPSVYG